MAAFQRKKKKIPNKFCHTPNWGISEEKKSHCFKAMDGAAVMITHPFERKIGPVIFFFNKTYH